MYTQSYAHPNKTGSYKHGEVLCNAVTAPGLLHVETELQFEQQSATCTTPSYAE